MTPLERIDAALSAMANVTGYLTTRTQDVISEAARLLYRERNRLTNLPLPCEPKTVQDIGQSGRKVADTDAGVGNNFAGGGVEMKTVRTAPGIGQPAAGTRMVEAGDRGSTTTAWPSASGGSVPPASETLSPTPGAPVSPAPQGQPQTQPVPEAPPADGTGIITRLDRHWLASVESARMRARHAHRVPGATAMRDMNRGR